MVLQLRNQVSLTPTKLGTLTLTLSDQRVMGLFLVYHSLPTKSSDLTLALGN